MQLEIIRSKRKSLSMQLKTSDVLLVRAPWYLTDPDIHRFIDTKKRWIDAKREQLIKNPGLAEDCITPEGFLYLKGQRVQISVHDGSNQIELTEQGGIAVYLKDADSQKLSRKIAIWRRDYATNYFKQELARQYGTFPVSLPPYSQSIRKMRRQWGNCSKSGHIKLNLELIRYPVECIQYVMQHELCHLLHFHHGREFYNLLAQVNPDWKSCREQLKKLSH